MILLSFRLLTYFIVLCQMLFIYQCNESYFVFYFICLFIFPYLVQLDYFASVMSLNFDFQCQTCVVRLMCMLSLTAVSTQLSLTALTSL